ncbi:MAG TPA: TldD/PmbA family protein [Candidatus Kapabacteria bacterium]|nr:TldD/PmbA family protein [Candidatus Kapabacteria bacterium]
MIRKNVVFLSLLLSFSIANASDVLIKGLQDEMNRTMNLLKGEEIPPYYIAYNVTTLKKVNISSKNGSILSSASSKNRILDIDLRVGDYKFDNTHIIRGNPIQFNFAGGAIQLPSEDNIPAIQNIIWNNTDKRFRAAVERYKKAETNQKVKVSEEDNSPDFSKEEAIDYNGNVKDFDVNIPQWEAMLKRVSAKFLNFPWILSNNVFLQTEVQKKVFVNTEGSKMTWYETNARLFIIAETKADDGMSLPLYRSYFSFAPDGLPTEEQVSKEIDKMIELLNELRKAPMAETYSGPAILSGEAAGVFFHEIFGHRVEGHREKDPNSSQTFKKSVGKLIMPDFISIMFDPTRKLLNNTELSGYYEYDNEGVKAEKVLSVDKGVFKSFLMSRSPIEDFPHSNGHGRAQAGFNPVSRQSNLIVESTHQVSQDSLIKLLQLQIKEQNKEYGFYFAEVSGGFTFTNRTIPNAFNVTPLVVYKIFADGRPKELVRGVDLIGTPLTTFKNILATGDDRGIFNGICGAESGGVPVSASSPSLLISNIEVQKKQKSQAKPPILESPKLIDNN